MHQQVSVAVVIPTYNAASQIEPLLLALAKQTLPHELLIIDSESNDQTQEIVSKFAVTLLTIPKSSFNHGSTRNIALSKTKADWVVFLTQDALPESDTTLETLMAMMYERADLALIYGRQLPYSTTRVFGRIAREIHYPPEKLVKDKSLIPSLGIRTCSCSNSFAAYRRMDILSVGGFPAEVILGEDVTVAARLILTDRAIGYCSEAKVYHAHNYSLSEEFKRYFDIGVFHEQEKDLLRQFDKSEKEGVGYVLRESSLLLREGKVYLLPEQILRTAVKYLAYKIGRRHGLLPKRFSRLLSMHPGFWR